MDPQTAWQQMVSAVSGGHWEEAGEYADGLYQWLQRGGFPPQTVLGHEMPSEWNHEVALAACWFVLSQANQLAKEAS